MARTFRASALASLLLLALLPLAAPAAHAANEPAAPSAPLGLVAEAWPERSEATLSWEAPAEPGRPHFNRYDVLRGQDGAPAAVVASVGANMTTFTDAGLSPGVSYTYQVQAASKKATGPASEPATVRFTAVPSAPRLTGGLLDDGRFHLQWTLPDSLGGSAFAGFRLYRGVDGDAPALYVTSDGLEYYDGLSPGHYYVYQVSAANADGEGPRSAPVNVTTPGGPSAPRGLQVTVDFEAKHAILSWQPPEDVGGSPIVQYDIVQTVDGSSLQWVGRVPGDVLTFTDTDFQFGPAYTYYVEASNSVAWGPRSEGVTVQETVVPSAPRDLSASPIDSNRIHVQWTLPERMGGSPFAGFRLYRAFAGEEPTFYLATDGLEYYDGVEAGRVYVYQVSAVNADGEGPRSAPAYAATEAPGRVPSPPRELTFDGIEHGDGTYAATLSWLPPEDPGDEPVFAYNVYRGDGGPEYAYYATAYDTTYTDPYLSYGPTYAYRVSAVSAAGEGQQSNAAGISTYNHPTAPFVTYMSVGQTEAFLAWEAPRSDGGAPVLQYNVYRSSAAEGEGRVGVTNGTSWTDLGLTPGTTYTYRVTAENAMGEGPHSEPVMGTTLPGPSGVPSEPRTLGLETFYSSDSDYGVRLTWLPPESDGGERVSHYTVYRSVDNGPEEFMSHSNGTTHDVYGLAYGSVHAFRVTASNSVGESQPSNVAAVQGYNHPGAPQGLAAYPGAGHGQVVLEWSPPWSTGGIPLDGYNVYRTAPGEPEALLASTPTAGWVDEAQPGVTYSYRVTAVNAIGEGPSTPTAEATATFLAERPSEPLGLTATRGPGAGEVSLAWQPPADPGGATVTAYHVYATIPAQGNLLYYVGMTQLGDGDGFHAFVDTGLAPGETRTYRVAASSVAGGGPLSAPATASAFDTPSAPQAVTAEPAVLGAAVAWQAPADDGGAPVVEYTLYRSVGGAEPQAIAFLGASETAYQDTDCTLLQVCEYRVAATNLVGEGGLSDGAATRGTGLPRV